MKNLGHQLLWFTRYVDSELSDALAALNFKVLKTARIVVQ